MVSDLASFILAHEKEYDCTICLTSPESSMMFDFKYRNGPIVEYWQRPIGDIRREEYLSIEQVSAPENQCYENWTVVKPDRSFVPAPLFTDYETFVRAMLYYEAFRTLFSEAR